MPCSNPFPLRSFLSCALLAACAACSGDAAPSNDAASGGAAATSQPSYSGGSGDADIAEIQDYELTMDDLRSWSEATAEMQRAAAESPEIAASFEQNESEDQNVDDSIDAMAERIESIPGARDIIEDAGLSAREYTVIFWTMMQAGMAQFSIEQGADPDEVAREYQVNPANLRFMKEHEAEIAALREQMDAQTSGN
ncbi:MAG: hypothetical protein ACREKM_07040 [Longimicrobiales bacterium]